MGMGGRRQSALYVMLHKLPHRSVTTRPFVCEGERTGPQSNEVLMAARSKPRPDRGQADAATPLRGGGPGPWAWNEMRTRNNLRAGQQKMKQFGAPLELSIKKKHSKTRSPPRRVMGGSRPGRGVAGLAPCRLHRITSSLNMLDFFPFLCRDFILHSLVHCWSLTVCHAKWRQTPSLALPRPLQPSVRFGSVHLRDLLHCSAEDHKDAIRGGGFFDI